MKIPPTAKRVFKGVIFDVYQWEQELFDGSTTTFEMLKRPHTLEVIATKGDKIIILEQEQPYQGRFLSLPGGRAEEGETELESAKRELLEETGLVSDQWILLKSYSPATKIDWSIHLFVARNCKLHAQPHLDGGEKIVPRELFFEEFVDRLCTRELKATELAFDVLMMMREPRQLEEFRKQIFG